MPAIGRSYWTIALKDSSALSRDERRDCEINLRAMLRNRKFKTEWGAIKALERLRKQGLQGPFCVTEQMDVFF